jgi:hypothetical protein
MCILADKTENPTLVRFLVDLEVLLGVEIIVVTLREIEDWDLIHPGIMILSGGKPEKWVTALGETHIGGMILEAFKEGLLLFVADAAASGLGSWVLSAADESPFLGLNWLVGSLVLPWIKDPAELESVRNLLSKPEPLYAMGLAGGRIIALGPNEEVQLWSTEAPTIVLGSGWRKP